MCMNAMEWKLNGHSITVFHFLQHAPAFEICESIMTNLFPNSLGWGILKRLEEFLSHHVPQ